MPRKEPRNYKQEYKEYHASKTQKKNRASRNSARDIMEKSGRVHKGDGKAVDHKVPLMRGGGKTTANLQVMTAKANRKKGIKRSK
jgi:5-methylcytosine-specific restriction endonuclease McrA